MQMTLNQTSRPTFQNRMIFRELNSVTLKKQCQVNTTDTQTLALTCSLRVESLHTWLAITVGLLQS